VLGVPFQTLDRVIRPRADIPGVNITAVQQKEYPAVVLGVPLPTLDRIISFRPPSPESISPQCSKKSSLLLCRGCNFKHLLVPSPAAE
jgi:hypothetical protein